MAMERLLNKELLAEAVEDLLKYCRDHNRNPEKGLGKGALLAPILQPASQVDNSEWDELALEEAMAAFVERELARWREELGVTQSEASAPMNVPERLREDLKADHENLTALSFTWAFYIKNINYKKLTEITGWSEPTIRTRIRAGLAAIIEAVARKERALLAASASNHHPAEYASQSTPRADFEPDPSLNMQTIKANSPAPSTQAAETRVHAHSFDASSKSLAVKKRRARWSAVLLMMVLTFWLATVAPWLMVAVLVALSSWRAVANVWHTVREWRESGREDNWWNICYLGPWLALCAWTINTAGLLPSALAAMEFSGARLEVALRCVFLAASLCALGLLDLHFWVKRAASETWPWHLVQPEAEWAWKQRWPLVALGWMLVVILSTGMMVSGLGNRL